MENKKYTEADLDNLINYFLDEQINCPVLPNVCIMLNNATGRKRIFDRVKHLIFVEGMEDIEACLTLIETEFDEIEN